MQSYLLWHLGNGYTCAICFKSSLSAHASRKSQLFSHFWCLSLTFFPAIQFSINLSQFSKWENEDQIAPNLITHFLLNVCPYYWKTNSHSALPFLAWKSLNRVWGYKTGSAGIMPPCSQQRWTDDFREWFTWRYLLLCVVVMSLPAAMKGTHCSYFRWRHLHCRCLCSIRISPLLSK